MTDLLKKKLKLIFEDGFLISRNLFGSDFEEDPRFFDSVYTFLVFGQLITTPIEGAFEFYYEKVEVDAFRKFLLDWEPELADFDFDNLPIKDLPEVINVVSNFSAQEKRDAITQFYGNHYINVVSLLDQWISELPHKSPYDEVIKNMKNLRQILNTRFGILNLRKNLPEKSVEALFKYWISSSMNYITKPFGPFGIIP